MSGMLLVTPLDPRWPLSQVIVWATAARNEREAATALAKRQLAWQSGRRDEREWRFGKDETKKWEWKRKTDRWQNFWPLFPEIHFIQNILYKRAISPLFAASCQNQPNLPFHTQLFRGGAKHLSGRSTQCPLWRHNGSNKACTNKLTFPIG